MDIDPEFALGFTSEAAGCCETAVSSKIAILAICLKFTSEICDVVFKTCVLGINIAPKLIEIDNNNGIITVDYNITNSSITFKVDEYRHAAYSYMAFYILGLLAALAYWVNFFCDKSFFKGKIDFVSLFGYLRFTLLWDKLSDDVVETVFRRDTIFRTRTRLLMIFYRQNLANSINLVCQL